MIKLTLLASLLASFTIAFGSARAGAQPLDPNQAQASPTPAAPPMLAADAGSPLQTAPPTEVADVEALPAAAPVGPGAERAVVTAPAPAGSEVEAKAAAEMAALQSDLASGGAANGNEQSRLNLYGFADFTYSRNQNPLAGAAASTFSVGNLNLYMASELGDEWRSLIEVRFMYLPNGGQSGATPFDPRIDTTFYDSTDWNRPLQWGGIHIERAWLERTFHKLLTVRVGNWLTPYGIWNVDHGSPVVIGIGRPFIVGEALFPASQTGIDRSRAEETTVREESVMLVVSQYLGSQRAAAEVEAARSRVELAQALYDQAADLQKNGVGTGIDTLRSNVELQNEKQRLIVARTQLQTSLYGASKMATEGLISAYVRHFGFQAWIFRFVSILGERYTHGHVYDFYRQLRAHPDHLEVLGNGQQRKSYLYVQDCIDAILLSLKSESPVSVLNLGTDEFALVDDSIGWICQELGISPKIGYSGGERGWVGDSPFILLDCARMRSLGWAPKLSIREGVVRTLRFLVEHPEFVPGAA